MVPAVSFKIIAVDLGKGHWCHLYNVYVFARCLVRANHDNDIYVFEGNLLMCYTARPN